MLLCVSRLEVSNVTGSRELRVGEQGGHRRQLGHHSAESRSRVGEIEVEFSRKRGEVLLEG